MHVVKAIISNDDKFPIMTKHFQMRSEYYMNRCAALVMIYAILLKLFFTYNECFVFQTSKVWFENFLASVDEDLG